ncbi:translation initiation factor IF-3 [Desulfonauticus submarinus]|uniref:Translation initiation factor IF-3 n=1 Tax=Desulfonauticus submarinus TaxID=206665 RepID=A0A1H0BK20_9BACT|nr:translation initiation factor IF-3 [Desulfonauticus submarinus]
MRLIKEDGKQAGIVSLKEALTYARDVGLDLVEVAPNAKPPVCKVMDYGKYLYEQQKKQQEAKKKQVRIQVKEIKVRPKTDENDLQTKIRHIKRFLSGGDRCKVTVFFRGRELAHKEKGLEILERIAKDLEELAKIEQAPKFEGRTMFMLLSPLAKKK